MNKTLDELREEIDSLDHELLQILAKRMSAVKEIGDLKNVQGLPVIDEKRYEEVVKAITEKAKSFHLSEDFIKKLFEAIHEHAVEIQKKV